MRPYPKGTGAGISLFIIIALGIYAVSRVEEMKRAAFRDGFNCAINENARTTHASYNCADYRESINKRI